VKVAIPVFGRWISPRFGFSPEMWILTIEGGELILKERLSMVGLTLPQWFNRLSSLGIDTLICGGIDGFCYRQLKALGISVIHEIVGDADETIDLFLKGKLQPGFRGCRKRFMHHGRRRAKFSGPPWIED